MSSRTSSAGWAHRDNSAVSLTNEIHLTLASSPPLYWKVFQHREFSTATARILPNIYAGGRRISVKFLSVA